MSNDKPTERKNSQTPSEITSPATRDLTLSDAMRGPALMRIAAEQGRETALALLMVEIENAARVCGGMDATSNALMADLILDRWRGRTLNALRLAIRSGLNSGKIYGKLTYPVIAEWLTAHEEAVEDMNYQVHLSTK